MKYSLLFAAASLVSLPAFALPELGIGVEDIEPGIVVVFEGAVKDEIKPGHLHLEEADTDVHLEARVNWGDKGVPKGAPAGGFVPYLKVTAKVVNEKTGKVAYVDLLPHVNLSDNLHYARNMALPGDKGDLYDVTFTILPPSQNDVSLHHDWVHTYGDVLFKEQSFSYKGIDFGKIVDASRR